MIHHLRQELCILKKQYKTAADEWKHLTAELWAILRKKLMVLRRGDGEDREPGSEQPSIASPFGFTKQLLRDKPGGRLECSTEEVNHYLQDTMSGSLREQELEPNKALISPVPGPHNRVQPDRTKPEGGWGDHCGSSLGIDSRSLA